MIPLIREDEIHTLRFPQLPSWKKEQETSSAALAGAVQFQYSFMPPRFSSQTGSHPVSLVQFCGVTQKLRGLAGHDRDGLHFVDACRQWKVFRSI